MKHHPLSRAERLKVQHDRFESNEDTRKKAKDHEGRAYRKLRKEAILLRETDDELKSALQAGDAAR